MINIYIIIFIIIFSLLFSDELIHDISNTLLLNNISSIILRCERILLHDFLY